MMPGRNHHTKRNHHHRQVHEKNLMVATLLNVVITVFKFTGGLLSGSLALLSDALNNLSDTFATLIAYLATLIGKRGADQRKRFMYKRLEILAALINAVILTIVSFFLIREAYERWNDPQPINSMIMVVVAMIGLLANVLAVIILRRDAGKSPHVRAAYIHLIGDSFSSVMVIIGGILIQIYGIMWIDPLITLLISLYILREAFVILKESSGILMQSAPEGLDLKRVRRKLEEIEYVQHIHHLHVWMMNDHEIHLEAHVEVGDDLKLSELRHSREEIEELLIREFNISHVTLQFEFDTNHSPALLDKQHL